MSNDDQEPGASIASRSSGLSVEAWATVEAHGGRSKMETR